MPFFPEPPNRIVRRAAPRTGRATDPQEALRPQRLPLRNPAFVPSELDHPHMPLYSSLRAKRTVSAMPHRASPPRFFSPKSGYSDEAKSAAAAHLQLVLSTPRSSLQPRRCVTAGDSAPLSGPRPGSVPGRCALSASASDWMSNGFESVDPSHAVEALESPRSEQPTALRRSAQRLPDLFSGRPLARPLAVKFV